MAALEGGGGGTAGGVAFSCESLPMLSGLSDLRVLSSAFADEGGGGFMAVVGTCPRFVASVRKRSTPLNRLFPNPLHIPDSKCTLKHSALL